MDSGYRADHFCSRGKGHVFVLAESCMAGSVGHYLSPGNT